MKGQEAVFKRITDERVRQDEMWGQADHFPLRWFSIIAAEFGKMCQEYNTYIFDNVPFHIDQMKKKAIDLAAVCVAMLEAFERVEEKEA